MNVITPYVQLPATAGYVDRDESPETTPVGNWGFPFAITADYLGRSLGFHLGAVTQVDKIELWCAGVTVIGKASTYRVYVSLDNMSYTEIESFQFRSQVIEGRTVDSFELSGVRAQFIKVHIPSEEGNGRFPLRLLQLDTRAYAVDTSVGSQLPALIGFRSGDLVPETGALEEWGSTATFAIDVLRNSVGIDLGETREVRRIDLINRYSSSKGTGKGEEYALYWSDDNVTYSQTEHVAFTQKIANLQLVCSFELEPIKARYFKVNTRFTDGESHFELYDNPQFRVKAFSPALDGSGGGISTAPLPAAQPFAIGSRTELFISRDLVEAIDGLSYTLHPGVKHEDRPVLTMDCPWEGYRQVMWGDVLFDEEEQLFKMWYFTDTGGSTEYFPHRWTLLYATSEDGINWSKPLTGTSTNNGKPTNAVAISGAVETASVTKDVFAPHDERYRMVTFTWDKRYQTMVSPDGINWTFTGSFGSGHDVASAVWDPYREKYVVLHKCSLTDPGYFHSVRRFFYTTTSSDFRTWTPSYRSLNTDAEDQLVDQVAKKLEEIEPIMEAPVNRSLMRTDIYGAGLYPHESGLIAFPWVFYANDEEAYYYTIDDGIDDVQLAFSRDGNNWSRELREPVIRRGEVRTAGPDATAQDNAVVSDWDCGWIYTASKAFDVGDEVWLYYNGSNYAHTQPAHLYEIYPEGHPRAGQSTGRFDHKTGTGAFRGEIGLVKWKRDRFVSVDAGQAEGMLTTKPIQFAGSNLLLNARIAADGYVKAELLDERGNVIPGFSAEECRALQGDQIYHLVRWSDHSSVSNLAGSVIKIRFYLKNGQLFSYRFGD
jgi:hypothetical protein